VVSIKRAVRESLQIWRDDRLKRRERQAFVANQTALLQNPNFTGWIPSEQFAERVRRGYQFALKSSALDAGYIWHSIDQKRADVHAALIDDNIDLAKFLGNPLQSNMYYGVDNFCRDIQAKAPLPAEKSYQEIVNLMRALAESLGAVRVLISGHQLPNPQKYDLHQETLEQLLDRIAASMGADLLFPSPWPREHGLRTRRGVVTYRAVHSLYQAQRVRERCRNGSKCLEIGGGMGRVANFAWQMGMRDYTIVDLPMTIVGQAVFLGATLGEQHVLLPGEKTEGRPAIRLLAPEQLFAEENRYDVVLNADSLTEMSRTYGEKYIAFLNQKQLSLISINHEVNEFMVRELATPKIRYFYPLRAGYVEEIYCFPQ
jgi:hypothetical protein